MRLSAETFLKIARITHANRDLSVATPVKRFLMSTTSITRVTSTKDDAGNYVINFYGNAKSKESIETAAMSVVRTVKSVWPETIKYKVTTKLLDDEQQP